MILSIKCKGGNMNRFKMKLLTSAILLLAIIGFTPVHSAFADEVEEAIQEGLDAYKDGSYTDAAGSLDYAAQLIRQKKGEQLEAVLPQPLPGWTAEEASSSAMGAAMFGGGVSVERQYTKAGSRVTVQIITDSPMLQGVMMMFSNPAFATADGGRLEKIKGKRAIVKYQASRKSGEIQMIIANRFLITIEGSQVEKADLKNYAQEIDFKTLLNMM